MIQSKRFNLYATLIVLCSLYFPFVVCSPNTQKDSILIACGSHKPLKLDDGRVYESDVSNTHVTISPISHSSVSSFENGLVPKILSSARVFSTSSIYTFSTKKIGRHWLRLHFYPVKNSKFDLSSAVFSVEANGITLIHEFGFFRGNKSYHLYKEYVVDVSSANVGKLVVGLLPWDNSIAFVNGIEVLSIPDKLFSAKVTPIPLGDAFELPGRVGFETVYRVDMGGSGLLPKDDPLWRKWESDEMFLVNSAAARNVSVNPDLIRYHDGVASDVAPNLVYATAEEMADANVNNQRFNISWWFEVEQGFGYFIRLHFCDIVGSKLHDLVFNVYINNQSAIDSLDISHRAKGLSTAYFVDFFTNVSMGSDNILVQVGPNHLTGYIPTALLNGLEIMKMSNPSDSLDGKLAMHLDSSDTKKSKKMRGMIVLFSCLAAGFVLVVLLLLSFILFLCCRHKKKPEKDVSVARSPIPTYVGNSGTKFSSNTFGGTTTDSHSLGQMISFSEVREATRNFDKTLILGAGGFGKVYKGVLENGLVVAVKRGNPRSQQGFMEFKTEIEMLSKLRHRHLVSLIGYCEELNEMILVYEFMAGGPLRRHLYGSNLPPLTWKQRIEILVEVLCARPAINPTLPREQVNIAEWAMMWQKKGALEKIMDQNIMGKVNLESLRKFGETAEKCLSDNGNERPSMGDVLWNLEYALQLQEASNGRSIDADSITGISDIPDMIPDVESVDIETISDLESIGTMRD
ncbi:serine/threonine/dual specificity protein kinase, catalytic domain-containing protein [Artemisia annua]|uniref:Serine/threonine/dual specificity protein kinase, catalytic domain-containing protein n=1 Tax=Artemisia annua TaxID=35608 RepID=A0A2U1PXG2_ARTAN|nr:serine/threonine/dual specificity protein kinase, catalytic domain-containing protein [Artemisia annua]